jgi:hypothetical protein
MASDLVPAIVAITGGSTLLGGIAAHEAKREANMRRGRRTYAVVFPAGAKPEAAIAALAAVSGSDYRFELVFEVVGDADGISHLLHLPKGAETSVIDILSAALPGIRCDLVEPRSTGAVTAAIRIKVPVGAVLRESEPAMASRALIAGMAALRNDERVSLRWAVRPGGTAPVVQASDQPNDRERAQAKAQRGRLGQPGFTVAGLLLVRAGSRPRAQLLARHITGVLRSRRGVGAGLEFGNVRPWDDRELPRSRFARGWASASELLPLLGIPLGDDLIAGVEIGAARRLMYPRGVPREGRRLFLGRDAYGERPVALSTEAAKRHLAVVGPSGAGKSVVLARLVLDSLQAGLGGVIIDLKGPDLVNTILDRVPQADADQVVVLDPATTGPVPGLHLLGVGDPDLRSDVMLGVLRHLFKDAWGPRTESYLRVGLRTLSDQPRPVLTDWIRLFTDTGFRRAAVARVSDPLLLAAWRSYDELSAAEQHQHVAAPMNRVMSLLARPAIRNVLAQESPRLDIDRLLRERKWLLVSLSPGVLGESASRLLGGICAYVVWMAIEARSALPEAARRPVCLVVDELQSLASLPWSIEHLFERSRGLGCGVTVATQGLGQLPDSLRTSLLANVGSLMTFRAGYDEATRLARELPGLGTADLQALRPYEVAARVSSGAGSGTAVMTGQTEALPPVTGGAARIRQQSAERYGGWASVAAVPKQSPAEANAETALGRGKRS